MGKSSQISIKFHFKKWIIHYFLLCSILSYILQSLVKSKFMPNTTDVSRVQSLQHYSPVNFAEDDKL